MGKTPQLHPMVALAEQVAKIRRRHPSNNRFGAAMAREENFAKDEEGSDDGMSGAVSRRSVWSLW